MVDSLLNPEHDMSLLVRSMEYTNQSFGKFDHFDAVTKGIKFGTSRTSVLLCFKANLIPSTRIWNRNKQQLNGIGKDIKGILMK